MGWRFDGNSNRSGVRRDFIQEGIVDLYLFKEEQDRVHFLIEPVDVQAVAKEKSITVPEAEELIYTKLSWDKWLYPGEPLSVWEHVISAVPQKRFFSAVVCPGMNACRLCAENNEAKARGVTENKLLPFSVRKRFILPLWSFALKRVLYMKQSQDFLGEIDRYIEKNGVGIDFDMFRIGRGFNTKYKSIYVGKSKMGELKDTVMSPDEVRTGIIISDEELSKRLGDLPEFPPKEMAAGSAETSVTQAPNVTDDEDVDAFALPFGTHKGRTLRELWDLGEEQYLEFLAQKASGIVNEKVKEFLAKVKE